MPLPFSFPDNIHISTDVQGHLKEDPTGFFGPKTEQAVMSWQRKNNIKPSTGIVGILSRRFYSKVSFWIRHHSGRGLWLLH